MDFWIGVLIQVILFAAIASSFNLLLGFSRLFSVAQGALVGFGAYAVAICTTEYGLAYPLALLIGVGLAGLVGLCVGLMALRISDDYLAIATFALQLVFTSSLEGFDDFTGGTYGMPGVPDVSIAGFEVDSPMMMVLVAGLVLALAIEVSRRIRSSPFGLSLRAAGHDEGAARALGKRPRMAKVVIVGLSGVLAGLAGGIYASYLGYILPETFDIHFSILLLSIVIIGGAGSLIGPAAGAALMIGLPEVFNQIGVTSSTVVYIRQLFFGLVLLVVVVVLKRGLVKPRYPQARTRRGDESALVLTEGVPVKGTGLRKEFGGITAIKGLDIELLPERVTGIVGPNGAGKTTMFDLLTGALPPTAGTVELGGHSLDSKSMDERAREGLVRSFQGLRLFPEMSVIENVMVAVPLGRDESAFTALFRRRRAAAATARASSEAAATLRAVGLDSGWERDSDELSYAEQKLLSLARAMAAKPKAILLDEPASGLDLATLERMTALIRELAAGGTTVCIVEHNTKVLAELSDRLVFIHLGEVLAAGPPEEITGDPELASIYFGVPAEDDDLSATIPERMD